MLFVKFKSQHLSVFQDWKHILRLTTDYAGADKNTECLLWSTLFSVQRVKMLKEVFISHSC